jgi:regulator of sigma E protease
MLAILSPILVFGIVIFVHELGHFLAAKWLGVYAPRFSIGFGPALWKRRRGETEYIVAAFPLGGYVRMASRHDEEAALIEGGSEEASKRAADDPDYDPEAMIPFGPKPVPEHRWFESKPLWARIIILMAGVTMNVLLGLVVSIGLAWSFGRPIVPTTVLGDVRPVAEVPALQQLRAGDSIAAVNGVPVDNWGEVTRRIGATAGEELRIATSRGEVRLDIPGRSPEERRATLARVAQAIDFHVPPVIDVVAPGCAAERAGIRTRDSVVAVNGAPVRTWQQVVQAITPNPGQEVVVRVRRADGEVDVPVVPTATEVPDPATGRPVTAGRIGVSVRDFTAREAIGFGEASVAGWNATWAMTGAVLGVLKGLVTAELSVKQLGGPIAIIGASVAAARTGLENFLYLVAFLSVNIAILNLLPIPILDGGQILINVAESVKGSPFSMRTREYILRVGLVAIGLLFVTVMFNDIMGLVRRLFG